MTLLWVTFFLFYLVNMCTLSSPQKLNVRDLVMVIVNQPDSHDELFANNLVKSVYDQADALKKGVPVIHFGGTVHDHPGSWTIIPLIPWLNSLHGSNSSFILFCHSNTHISLVRLLEFLQKLDPRQEKFLGYRLHDRDATIIHHFAMPKRVGHFKYPSFAAGFIFSRALLNRLAQRLRDRDLPKHPEFSIDASFELSLYIWNEGKGIELTHVDSMCVKPGPHCATRPITFESCGKSVPKDEIFFAVKTCSKFHDDRLPVVKKTWSGHAHHIGFFSDLEDTGLGTIDLGIPNTERGHCGKTQAILHYVNNQSHITSKIKWLVITDDDTILSVGRIQMLLSCYNASEKIAIGERYGYNVVLPQHFGGYNYITGGGGMVFSLSLVKELVGTCICPSDSTPDDMHLGICLTNMDIPITHSPLFHQARPSDYAADYLAPQEPISFHKHWMVDPYQVYYDWFYHADIKLSKPEPHSEL